MHLMMYNLIMNLCKISMFFLCCNTIFKNVLKKNITREKEFVDRDWFLNNGINLDDGKSIRHRQHGGGNNGVITGLFLTALLGAKTTVK